MDHGIGMGIALKIGKELAIYFFILQSCQIDILWTTPLYHAYKEMLEYLFARSDVILSPRIAKLYLNLQRNTIFLTEINLYGHPQLHAYNIIYQMLIIVPLPKI